MRFIFVWYHLCKATRPAYICVWVCFVFGMQKASTSQLCRCGCSARLILIPLRGSWCVHVCCVCVYVCVFYSVCVTGRDLCPAECPTTVCLNFLHTSSPPPSPQNHPFFSVCTIIPAVTNQCCFFQMR